LKDLESYFSEHETKRISSSVNDLVTLPCAANLTRLIDTIKDIQIRHGKSDKDAQTYIDNHPISFWVNQAFQETLKRGLIDRINEAKKTGFIALVEEEVFGLLRFKYSNQNSIKILENWKKENKGKEAKDISLDILSKIK
jgi:hypothetical protein